MNGQVFELIITASAVVTDVDGNVVGVPEEIPE